LLGVFGGRLVLFFAGVAAGEDAFLWFLLDLIIEFFVASKGLNLISLLLFPNLLELLLRFLQLLLLYFVESFELVLQIVQISIFVHIGFLQRC
jgi:hypothetical protein